MNAAAQTPADTRMMTIVHRALRRDLGRTRQVLAAEDLLTPARRADIGTHLLWLMEFLHAHHEGEDRGLWPRVRTANPDAGELLDQMDRDHHSIAPGMDAVDRAAESFRQGGPGSSVLEAINTLESTLLPHLKREEEEMMPVVSASISHDEWEASDQKENIEGRSAMHLGMVGHWLIDGLTPDEAELVTGLVPPAKRFVLVHGIGPVYRSQARRRWGAAPSGFGVNKGRAFPLAIRGTASVEVAATPEQVWTVLADPTRVGEWSHEAVGAQWLNGADSAVPGAWFQGRSRAGIFTWRRKCLITEAQPYRRLVWQTRGGALARDCTEWAYTLESTDIGTRVTQTFAILSCAKWYARVIALAVPAHKGRADALAIDLRNLGNVAAAAERVTSPVPPHA